MGGARRLDTPRFVAYRHGFSRRHRLAKASTCRRSHRRFLGWSSTGAGNPLDSTILLARWWLTPRSSAISTIRSMGGFFTLRTQAILPSTRALGGLTCVWRTRPKYDLTDELTARLWLIDCEDDRTLRAVLVAMLRHLNRYGRWER